MRSHYSPRNIPVTKRIAEGSVWHCTGAQEKIERRSSAIRTYETCESDGDCVGGGYGDTCDTRLGYCTCANDSECLSAYTCVTP